MLIFVIWLAILRNSSAAATNYHDNDVSDHVIVLREIIENTDGDLYQYWSDYREQEKMFNENFDQWVCTENETELRTTHSEMVQFVQKALSAWDSKQTQLKAIHTILHHEEYANTALVKELDKYITEANQTAQDEKKELDVHELEVIGYKEKLANHSCPCVWATWSEWSECSKTCREAGLEEAGTKSRTRSVATNVRHEPCDGGSDETIKCNDVCCPVDCVWGAWEAWPACPSGWPEGGGLQEKMRLRTKSVETSCNGSDCDGEDFEKETCIREEELLKEHDEVVKQFQLEKDQLAMNLEKGRQREEELLKEHDEVLKQLQVATNEKNQCATDLDECTSRTKGTIEELLPSY